MLWPPTRHVRHQVYKAAISAKDVMIHSACSVGNTRRSVRKTLAQGFDPCQIGHVRTTKSDEEVLGLWKRVKWD